MISHYRGYTPNQSRYRRMMLVGYLIPTIIVIMAIVTDKVAPECATLKPGIGDNSCFFAGNIDFVSILWYIIILDTEYETYNLSIVSYFTSEWTAKFFWFHFPMSIALFINTCVYIDFIYALCQSKRQDSTMLGNLKSHRNKREMAEK